MIKNDAPIAITNKDLESVTCWLLVERIENWNQDSVDGFKQFGLPKHKEKMGRSIQRGDFLFFYVSSGRSSFADIRKATEPGLTKLRLGGSYDTPFPWCVHTTPILTLPLDKWVPIKHLINDLSLTRNKKDWRQVMRTSLRQLDVSDATTILEAMKLSFIPSSYTD